METTPKIVILILRGKDPPQDPARSIHGQLVVAIEPEIADHVFPRALLGGDRGEDDLLVLRSDDHLQGLVPEILILGQRRRAERAGNRLHLKGFRLKARIAEDGFVPAGLVSEVVYEKHEGGLSRSWGLDNRWEGIDGVPRLLSASRANTSNERPAVPIARETLRKARSHLRTRENHDVLARKAGLALLVGVLTHQLDGKAAGDLNPPPQPEDKLATIIIQRSLTFLSRLDTSIAT